MFTFQILNKLWLTLITATLRRPNDTYHTELATPIDIYIRNFIEKSIKTLQH